MSGSAAKVTITERQQEILVGFAEARKVDVGLAQRSRIVLLAFEKLTNECISEIVELNPDQVGIWRRRWQDAWNSLIQVECGGTPHELRKAIEKALADLPRSGRPARISSEQQAKLISLACEDPEDSGRPITNWSGRELADEIKERGIIDRISPGWVSEILRRANLRPHRSRYWLFSKDRRDRDFDQRVASICTAYTEAISLYEQHGIHTISIDEQTGIQALERIAPDLLPKPGHVAKREFEYERHGTTGLFGNLHVATGEIIAPMVRETRSEEDFLENLNNVVCIDPEGTFRLVRYNLNTHCSESCVRFVAAACGCDTDLGIKGRRGILKSVKTRVAFLSDPTHRIQFLYVPRHSSWLNQIEIWFGVLRRKVTRLGTFTSVEHLTDKILQFIDYYNNTMAHPYRWTYQGRVLAA